MKILFATFEKPSEFLAAFDARSRVLEVHTRTAIGPGDPCVVEIGFPGLPNRVLVRARFVSCDAPTSRVRVELEEGQEKKAAFLVRIARGEPATWRRKYRRFPVRLPARVQVEGTAIKSEAETEDVGGGGVFLRTPSVLPEHARVQVALDPCDGSSELVLKGQVAWVRAERDDATGMGVGFDDLSGEDMKRLRTFMRMVKTLGKVNEWEDAAAPVEGEKVVS